MHQLPHRPAPSEEEELSFARAAAFFVTLAIVAVLVLVGSAQAMSGEEGEEPGEEADVCFASAFEFEEEEEFDEGEAEACEEEADVSGDEECILTSASATVTAAAEPGKLRLAIRYRSASPALVSVGYKLRGGKGSLSFGPERVRFGRAGVFRDSESLEPAQMERVLAAKEFTVELHAANSPRPCRSRLRRQLSVRTALPGGMLWAEPSARQGRL